MTGNQQARNWAMGCHLAALTAYVGVPFGNILGPLIIWLLKKDEFPLVDEHGKQSLNFQISMIIYGLVLGVAIIISTVTVILIPVAVLLGMLLAFIIIADFVLVVIAAIKVSNGETYQYPFTIRFIQ
ncbi:MAG: DUF4870 domain-containing protein [Syntrophomonadaceae bacterium]|nr:DUF4870 domain-containing protein [Syntrophomonadaceae bacterium]